MKKHLKTGLVGLMAFSFSLGVALAKEGPDPSKAPALDPPSASARVVKKADLVVEGISVTRTGVADGMHQVRIDVKVKNNGGPTASSKAPGAPGVGEFKVLVEWTADPTSGWTFLCNGGILPLGHGESNTITCTDRIPIGKFKKYRATADYTNWIAESNEGNNVNSAGYTTTAP
jgi:hypothetical protein